MYNENYGQIKAILNESRTLGKGINVKQVEASQKDLEQLYNGTKTSDVFELRLQYNIRAAESACGVRTDCTAIETKKK